MTAQHHLPREITSLALGRAMLVVRPNDKDAHELTWISSRHATAHWQPIRQLLPTRDRRERNSWVHCDYANGAPPLAVGYTPRLDARTPAYYVALDDEVLRHEGRPLLFGDRHR